jgi:hypothetical protein
VSDGDGFSYLGTFTNGGNSSFLVKATASGDRIWLWGGFTDVGERRQNGLVILDATIPKTWPEWSAGTFRLQPPPPGDEGPGGDPDGDGAEIFLEYAMGTDPLDPESGGQGLLVESKAPLRVSLPRNPDAASLLPMLEFSPDLQRWSPVAADDFTETSDAGRWRFELKPDFGFNSYFRIRFQEDQ